MHLTRQSFNVLMNDDWYNINCLFEILLSWVASFAVQIDLCTVMIVSCFQAVQLGSCERLLAFCEAVQRNSPVSSFAKPIAGVTPGYASEVLLSGFQYNCNGQWNYNCCC